MANKKISDLPLLEADNLNPSAAYIIVEQGGVTYKMRALGFGGSSGYAESLRDSKSTSLYAPADQTTTLTFDQIGINNTASAWSLNFVAENTENGSRAHHGISSNRSEVGDKRSLRITKVSGLDLINVGVNSYSISSSPKLKIGYFSLESSETSGSKSVYDPYTRNVDYYVTINCSNSDKIVLVLSSARAIRDHSYHNNDPGKYGWEWFPGIRANITATIDGTISA